ncbi:PP2C family protein-serine/threonine phosphatase [Nonomuraea ceibae]|uniref:PP2C family protein-serine/threonine phosphatase n=1 Tax=Nonomuraea ceibae TaxID=1935170 RepID=UPI001C5E5510|nr:GAF domain-containing SpoIIE family protein phosphatase [Nonomuraea ceibae]
MSGQNVAPLDVAGEQARLAAVRRYDILDTPADGAFDRVAALAARLFDTPIATVTIVDEDRIWFKAQQGLPEGVTEIGRDPGLCASAILQGEPYVVTDALADPRTLNNPLVHGDLGVQFYAAAPITTVDGYRLGTVNVLDIRPRAFSDQEAAVLAELAGMVADSLELRLSAMAAVRLEAERAAQAERERRQTKKLAATLRRALLPPVLPKLPGVHAAAAYHTASADDVGGDFYDLFPLDDGRWAFFIGDVCGKGSEAAAMTALARYSLRVSVQLDTDPVIVLQQLNTAMLHEYTDGDPCYCTVLFGLLTPSPLGIAVGGVQVELAAGGHPPALHLQSTGQVQPVSLIGGMVTGLMEDAGFTTTKVHLQPGDALLMYTDGLTEARVADGHLFGEDRLITLVGSFTGASAPELVAALESVLDGFGPGLADDTAILALSIPPTASPTKAIS